MTKRRPATQDTPEYKRIRKIRYQLIMESTGDSKLAAKARSWSNDRILHELGFYVPKKIKHRKVKPIIRQKPVIEAVSLKGKGKKPRKLTKKEIADAYKRQRYAEAKERRKKRIKTARIKQWAVWSGVDKDRYYETDRTWRWLTNSARRVNRIKGFKNEEGKNYSENEEGYMIVYNAYIHQEPIADWIEKMVFIGFEHETYKVVEISRSRR